MIVYSAILHTKNQLTALYTFTQHNYDDDDDDDDMMMMLMMMMMMMTTMMTMTTTTMMMMIMIMYTCIPQSFHAIVACSVRSVG